MATRSGDIDPAVVFHLARNAGMSLDEIETMRNRRSWLRGLCGESDVRSAHELADTGDEAAAMALEVYAYRIRTYIGTYLAAVPGVHAPVFTAGAGENDPDLRAAACRPLAHLGLCLDEAVNAETRRGTLGSGRHIDDGNGPLRVLVIATDEESESPPRPRCWPRRLGRRKEHRPGASGPGRGGDGGYGRTRRSSTGSRSTPGARAIVRTRTVIAARCAHDGHR